MLFDRTHPIEKRTREGGREEEEEEEEEEEGLEQKTRALHLLELAFKLVDSLSNRIGLLTSVDTTVKARRSSATE
jgi:CO dehydrogenase/acetyl-CoA synthase beta subunit